MFDNYVLVITHCCVFTCREVSDPRSIQIPELEVSKVNMLIIIVCITL